jgi:hypothetical protein
MIQVLRDKIRLPKEEEKAIPPRLHKDLSHGIPHVYKCPICKSSWTDARPPGNWAYCPPASQRDEPTERTRSATGQQQEKSKVVAIGNARGRARGEKRSERHG